MKSYFFILLAILMLISSCASVLNLGDKEVLIHSNPRGLSVFIDDSLYGETPVVAGLNKKQDHYVSYALNDSIVYKDTLKSEYNLGLILVDFLFPTNYFIYTIPIPFIFDYYTGSYKSLNKSELFYDHVLANDTLRQLEIKDSINSINLSEYQKINDKLDRLNNYSWEIQLNNNEVLEKLKIINSIDDNLEVIASNNLDTIGKAFKNFHFKSLYHFEVPIEEVKSIIYKEETSFGSRVLISICGIGLGVGMGVLIRELIKAQNANVKKSGDIPPSSLVYLIYYGVFGIVGLISSLFFDNSKELKIDLTNLDNKKKMEIINREILVKSKAVKLKDE